MNKQNSRVGEKIVNKYGTLTEIIQYNNHDNIIVLCDNKYMVQSRYDVFKRGGTLSPYDKFVLNIGYQGEGIYNIRENNKDTFLYTEWHSMLARCYNNNQQISSKTRVYETCSVCNEWNNFQNFAQWYTDNYYKIEGEKLHLDKDILCKGNQIYSPTNCILVPTRINMLFAKSKKSRGEYPIGVTFNKKENKFHARCSVYVEGKSKNKSLGYYITQEEAFYKGYKPFKEKYIKEVADQYKDKIPKKLYDAMYKYEVEITD